MSTSFNAFTSTLPTCGTIVYTCTNAGVSCNTSLYKLQTSTNPYQIQVGPDCSLTTFPTTQTIQIVGTVANGSISVYTTVTVTIVSPSITASTISDYTYYIPSSSNQAGVASFTYPSSCSIVYAMYFQSNNSVVPSYTMQITTGATQKILVTTTDISLIGTTMQFYLSGSVAGIITNTSPFNLIFTGCVVSTINPNTTSAPGYTLSSVAL